MLANGNLMELVTAALVFGAPMSCTRVSGITLLWFLIEQFSRTQASHYSLTVSTCTPKSFTTSPKRQVERRTAA